LTELIEGGIKVKGERLKDKGLGLRAARYDPTSRVEKLGSWKAGRPGSFEGKKVGGSEGGRLNERAKGRGV
jgi:hypothetical protein